MTNRGILAAGFRARASLLAMATSVALAAMPAWAQDEGAAAPDDDDSVIIVTAQLRQQNLQDVPLSVSAVSGEMLEARSQTTLTDITAQMPSLLLQRNPAGQGNSIRVFIRGVGQSDQSPSVEPGVGTYIDDIYYGTVLGSAFDLTDIERVEVLRGPQGTLAGMNTLGGAIKIFSRKPEGYGGYVEASVGNLGRRDVKASADFTVVPDAVFARITGVTRNRDGHVTRYDYACLNPDDPDVVDGDLPRLATTGDCVLGEMGNQQMYALRGALRIAPAGSPLEINLSADYTKDSSETQASVLIASAESANAGTASPLDRSGLSIPWQGVAYDDRFVTYGVYRRADAVLNDPYASYANFYDPGVMYSAIGAPPGPPAGYIAGAPLGPFTAPSITNSAITSRLNRLPVTGTCSARRDPTTTTHQWFSSRTIRITSTNNSAKSYGWQHSSGTSIWCSAHSIMTRPPGTTHAFTLRSRVSVRMRHRVSPLSTTIPQTSPATRPSPTSHGQ
jgi:iron complex outermembrane receptor protein